MERSNLRTRLRLTALATAIGCVVLLAAILGYVVGGQQGSQDGYLFALFQDEAIDGATAVHVLNAIERGDVDEATRLLESTVDGALLTYWSQADTPRGRFEPGPPSDKIVPLYRDVIARYRSTNASLNPDEGVQSSIGEALAILDRERD